ncbi:MAG: proline dehydrogenase family protein [Fimbriimonas sp.]
MFGRNFILRTAGLPAVERMVRRSRPFRPLVERFIAGDSLGQALAVGERVLGRGMMVSLDFLGENTKSEAEAASAKATYIAMLEAIAQSPAVKDWSPVTSGLVASLVNVDPRPLKPVEPLNISIKLTQCGLDMGDELAERNFREVLETAKRHGNFVRVDMEASDYTERTIQMIERVMPEFQANTGTVLQSYLYRTPDDVERMIALNARVRLVKGAYLEPASVAHPEKSKVDEAYVNQAKRLLDAANYPAIATQDESIILELKRYILDRGIDKSKFEFQMLYGIRRDLQENLLAEGFQVRIYIPFGDSWYPYFTRRLAERPANAMFIVRSFLKG